jgi:hypothetical protein
MRTRRRRPRPFLRLRPRSPGSVPPDVIVLAVRWYLRFGLSYRGVEELLAERGVEVDHISVYRRVGRFTSLLADAARVIITGHALVQNVRRGHYELAVEAPESLRVAVAFDELATAI